MRVCSPLFMQTFTLRSDVCNFPYFNVDTITSS